MLVLVDGGVGRWWRRWVSGCWCVVVMLLASDFGGVGEWCFKLFSYSYLAAIKINVILPAARMTGRDKS